MNSQFEIDALIQQINALRLQLEASNIALSHADTAENSASVRIYEEAIDVLKNRLITLEKLNKGSNRL